MNSFKQWTKPNQPPLPLQAKIPLARIGGGYGRGAASHKPQATRRGMGGQNRRCRARVTTHYVGACLHAKSLYPVHSLASKLPQAPHGHRGGGDALRHFRPQITVQDPPAGVSFSTLNFELSTRSCTNAASADCLNRRRSRVRPRLASTARLSQNDPAPIPCHLVS